MPGVTVNRFASRIEFQNAFASLGQPAPKRGIPMTALVTATGISGDQWGSDCFPIQQVADPTRALNPVRIPLSPPITFLTASHAVSVTLEIARFPAFSFLGSSHTLSGVLPASRYIERYRRQRGRRYPRVSERRQILSLELSIQRQAQDASRSTPVSECSADLRSIS